MSNFSFPQCFQKRETEYLWSIGLALSQKTNFRLFQTERVAADNFKSDENGRKFFAQLENMVGKGENAGYDQFLLFPQCFQMTCSADT